MITNVIFTAATNEIVTLAKAKKQLRIESAFEDEDDLIQSYIDAAVVASENYIGGHIQEKEMVITLDAFDSPYAFEAFPVQTVDGVTYYPADGSAAATLDAADYSLTKNGNSFYLRFVDDTPQTDIRFDAVTITATVGFADTLVPNSIQQAILLQIADMYERREDRGEITSTTSMALLRPYKRF